MAASVTVQSNTPKSAAQAQNRVVNSDTRAHQLPGRTGSRVASNPGDALLDAQQRDHPFAVSRSDPDSCYPFRQPCLSDWKRGKAHVNCHEVLADGEIKVVH